MIYHVYVHKYVLDILSQFGEINSIVNRIVDLAMTGAFDIQTLPKAPDRNPGEMTQLHVDIHNAEYNELVESRGNTSSSVSLRRIIYYFVDNEVYNELGWEATNIAAHGLDEFAKKLSNVITAVIKLKRVCPVAYTTQYNNLLSALKELDDAYSSKQCAD